jgi:hypothetical protein
LSTTPRVIVLGGPNSAEPENPVLIALGRGATIDLVGNATIWNDLRAECGYGE